MNIILINIQQYTICGNHYHFCCYYSMFDQTASCTRAHSLSSYMIRYDYHQLLIT
jgi:hypothetical protein